MGYRDHKGFTGRLYPSLRFLVHAAKDSQCYLQLTLHWGPYFTFQLLCYWVVRWVHRISSSLFSFFLQHALTVPLADQVSVDRGREACKDPMGKPLSCNLSSDNLFFFPGQRGILHNHWKLGLRNLPQRLNIFWPPAKDLVASVALIVCFFSFPLWIAYGYLCVC